MKKLTRRQLITLGSVGAFGALLGEALLEPNRLETIRRNVRIQNLPPSFEGFRIGVLSDIHWGHAIDHTFVSRAIHLLLETKPDLIVLPGDFFHSSQFHSRELQPLEGLFGSLSAKHGVVGVLGNHDHGAGADLVRKELSVNSPIRLIDNDHLMIEIGSDSLAVGGVGDLWEDEVKLDRAFAGVAKDIPRILLSHNPDVAEQVKIDPGTRVDLQISGHTHGGQMVLPGIYDLTSEVSSYGSKFNRDLVKGKRHQVFISKGIARLNRMRFCALPDVACLTLVRA